VQNPKLLGVLAIGVVVGAGLAWAVAAGDGKGAEVPQDAAPVDSAPQRTAQDLLLDARSKGSSSAPITIYEASDFQCPYCRQFWESTLPELERDYIAPGKARFIFLNLPLPQLHENAAAAHEFAMCAAKQDRFWEVHDLLYQHQQGWAGLSDPSRYFISLGDSAGLSRDDLLQCFDSGSVRWIVQAEAQMNFRAGVSSTPSFIIEGALLTGAIPIDMWRPILDSIITEKTGG
jgi:protein-disulfide isomerase